MPTTIHITDKGNQNISGVKTFFDSGIFSNGGVSAVPLLNNPLSIVGSGNNYVQLNIQNRATGLIATADLVITANNGTDNSNFINLGINNSGYSDPLFNNTTGLDGYLIMDGGDLDIGTRTPGKIIEFHAGGTTESNVIARISENGLNIVSGTLTAPYGVYAPNIADIFPASTGKRRYVPEATVTFGTSVPPTGFINYFPIIIKKDAINPNIAIETTTATSVENIVNVGIYSGAGFEGATLFYSGKITIPSISSAGIYRTITNFTLPKGAYILGSCYTGTAATSTTYRNIAANGFLTYFGVPTGMSTFLDAGSASVSDFVAFETGFNNLTTIIGTGSWTRLSKSPAVCLEY
jgi:hypothetical protein